MNKEKLTVYFDGSCSLCQLEIEHYRREDRAGRLHFCDVSINEIDIGPDLTQRQAMARFHVRSSNGELMSGAKAFVAVWRVLPSWRLASKIAKLPAINLILEAAYRAFLPLRPLFARLIKPQPSTPPGYARSDIEESP